MGRRPSTPDAIPRLRQRQRGRKTYYFYDHGIGRDRKRREEPLGTDYGLAVKRWAEIENEGAERPHAVLTFRYVCDRYRAEVMPTKAPATQAGNRLEIGNLLEFFDDPPGPLDAIEPIHVRQFMDWRGRTAKARANREKALLSHIWNWARNKGYTSLPNPCAGIRGFAEPGRDAYVDDAMFTAVWTQADEPTRDAMDVAYLTGQRPSDVLRMQVNDIRDGALEIRQAKTGAKIRMAVTGELEAVIARIADRKRAYPVHSLRLVVNEHGQPLTLQALQDRFAGARERAGVAPGVFQFRDLRAKAGTDKADSTGDVRAAQRQLGHTSVVMTEHYVRQRRGAKVNPTR